MGGKLVRNRGAPARRFCSASRRHGVRELTGRRWRSPDMATPLLHWEEPSRKAAYRASRRVDLRAGGGTPVTVAGMRAYQGRSPRGRRNHQGPRSIPATRVDLRAGGGTLDPQLLKAGRGRRNLAPDRRGRFVNGSISAWAKNADLAEFRHASADPRMPWGQDLDAVDVPPILVWDENLLTWRLVRSASNPGWKINPRLTISSTRAASPRWR
jgi:hypothetical protein